MNILKSFFLNLKKHTYIYTTLLLFSLNCHSQEIFICGRITDENKIHIQFANINLLDKGNKTYIKGTISDEQGKFKLSLKPGAYLLEIATLNYENWQKEIVLTDTIDLKQIILTHKPNELKEVRIKAVPQEIIRKADRFVINVSNNAIATGKSALELFNIAPGVWVEQSGGISINGVSGTRVMIDGKLLRFSNDQLRNYLSTIRAGEISTIEIIAHPSAEYEAEGSSGLINIILKKTKIKGLNGTVSTGTNYGKSITTINSVLLNYKSNSWLFYGSYDYNNIKDKTSIKDYRNQNKSVYNSESTILPTSNTSRYKFGLGFDISKNHFIGSEISSSFKNRNSSTISKSSILLNKDQSGSLIYGDFSSKSRSKFINLNLSYKWKTDTAGSNFKVLLDYVYNKNQAEGNFNSTYRDLNDAFLRDSIYRNNIPNLIKNESLTIDHTQILSKRTNIVFGGKFSKTRTNNEILYESLKNNQYTIDKSVSNNFNYSEKISAAYFKINMEIFKIDLSLGIRGEHTQTNGESITLETKDVRKYFNIFPSLFLKKSLNKETGNSFTFYAGRRINRPSFADLNPFVLRIDDFTYVTGNPNLRPQYTNALELGYTLHNKYSFSTYYNHTTDVFTQILISNNSNISAIYQKRNVDELNNYGLSVYAPVEITKRWKIFNSLSLYKNDYKFDEIVNNLAVYQIKTYHSFDAGSGINLQLLASYMSKSNQGNLIFKPNYAIDFAIQKSLFNDKVKIDFTINDVFNTKRADYYSNYNGFYLEEKQKYLTRSYVLTLSYNFFFGKKFKAGKVESGNQDEKSRIGNR